MKITIKSIAITDGKLVVEPTPESAHNIYQIVSEIKNSKKIYIAEILPEKKKRSLNSNSYCWLLIGKIADLLRRSKEDIYFEMLKSYGQSTMISVISEAVEMLKRTVKYSEEAGTSVLNGKDFVHLKIFMGSSEFDQGQMSIFISGIVDECHTLDINTLTPEEISLMNSKWDNK